MRGRLCSVLLILLWFIPACGTVQDGAGVIGAPPTVDSSLPPDTDAADRTAASPGSKPTEAPTTTSTAPPTTVAPTTTSTTLNLYAETGAGKLSPSVKDFPPRVYVPNSDANTLTVIDPTTYQVIATYPTDAVPHHVTPSWDMQTLYVNNTSGNTLMPIDPRTGKPGPAFEITDPYNLYFSPDGALAIVVAERYRRLDLRNPKTWELITSISVPYAGVNHGDFSPDGRYFYASCEFSGWVVKIDLVERRIATERQIGSEPIDVKFSPDASVLYVAEQTKGGVAVLDPTDLSEIEFIPTGKGTHGLYPSRDGKVLYVTNRLGGSVSVIDFASRAVVATWTVPGGGSPDMGSVSADGKELWLSGRYHGEVYVFDTTTGELKHRIKTGAGTHGLTYFPQPGRYSLGHTGNYR